MGQVRGEHSFSQLPVPPRRPRGEHPLTQSSTASQGDIRRETIGPLIPRRGHLPLEIKPPRFRESRAEHITPTTWPILRGLVNFDPTDQADQATNTEIAPTAENSGADVVPNEMNEVTVPDQGEEPQNPVPPEVE